MEEASCEASPPHDLQAKKYTEGLDSLFDEIKDIEDHVMQWAKVADYGTDDMDRTPSREGEPAARSREREGGREGGRARDSEGGKSAARREDPPRLPLGTASASRGGMYTNAGAPPTRRDDRGMRTPSPRNSRSAASPRLSNHMLSPRVPRQSSLPLEDSEGDASSRGSSVRTSSQRRSAPLASPRGAPLVSPRTQANSWRGGTGMDGDSVGWDAHQTVASLREEVGLLNSESKRKEHALLESAKEIEELKLKVMELSVTQNHSRSEIRQLNGEKSEMERLLRQQQQIVRSLEAAEQKEQDRRVKSGSPSKPIAKAGAASKATPTSKSTAAKNSAAMQKLAEENAYLVAALQRYDSAVSFLKQTVAIIMTKVHRDVLEDGAQTQLQALLDSLIRLKQQHIFPPSGSASDVSASSPLTRSALSHQDAALLEEESRKLRVANRKLSETVETQARTIRSQNARISSLNDRLDGLAASMKESKKRRTVMSGKHAGSEAGSANASPDKAIDGPERGSEDGDGDEGAAGAFEAPAKDVPADKASVPLELYEHMEREAVLLRSELRHKEIALSERQEIVEHLERKLHVVAHARESEVRKIRREAAAAIAGVKMHISEGAAAAAAGGAAQPGQGAPKPSLSDRRGGVGSLANYSRHPGGGAAPQGSGSSAVNGARKIMMAVGDGRRSGGGLGEVGQREEWDEREGDDASASQGEDAGSTDGADPSLERGWG